MLNEAQLAAVNAHKKQLEATFESVQVLIQQPDQFKGFALDSLARLALGQWPSRPLSEVLCPTPPRYSELPPQIDHSALLTAVAQANAELCITIHPQMPQFMRTHTRAEQAKRWLNTPLGGYVYVTDDRKSYGVARHLRPVVPTDNADPNPLHTHLHPGASNAQLGHIDPATALLLHRSLFGQKTRQPVLLLTHNATPHAMLYLAWMFYRLPALKQHLTAPWAALTSEPVSDGEVKAVSQTQPPVKLARHIMGCVYGLIRIHRHRYPEQNLQVTLPDIQHAVRLCASWCIADAIGATNPYSDIVEGVQLYDNDRPNQWGYVPPSDSGMDAHDRRTRVEKAVNDVALDGEPDPTPAPEVSVALRAFHYEVLALAPRPAKGTPPIEHYFALCQASVDELEITRAQSAYAAQPRLRNGSNRFHVAVALGNPEIMLRHVVYNASRAAALNPTDAPSGHGEACLPMTAAELGQMDEQLRRPLALAATTNRLDLVRALAVHGGYGECHPQTQGIDPAAHAEENSPTAQLLTALRETQTLLLRPFEPRNWQALSQSAPAADSEPAKWQAAFYQWGQLTSPHRLNALDILARHLLTQRVRLGDADPHYEMQTVERLRDHRRADTSAMRVAQFLLQLDAVLSAHQRGVPAFQRAIQHAVQYLLTPLVMATAAQAGEIHPSTPFPEAFNALQVLSVLYGTLWHHDGALLGIKRRHTFLDRARRRGPDRSLMHTQTSAQRFALMQTEAAQIVIEYSQKAEPSTSRAAFLRDVLTLPLFSAKLAHVQKGALHTLRELSQQTVQSRAPAQGPSKGV